MIRQTSWQPITSVPAKEGVPFLLRMPVDEDGNTAIVEVEWFESNLYPCYLGGNLGWEDRIVESVWIRSHWMDIPQGADPEDTAGLLEFLADIRLAMDDEHGSLMQDEFIKHCHVVYVRSLEFEAEKREHLKTKKLLDRVIKQFEMTVDLTFAPGSAIDLRKELRKRQISEMVTGAMVMVKIHGNTLARIGEIRGESRDGRCWKIRYPGYKTSHSIHKDFVYPIEKNDA